LLCLNDGKNVIQTLVLDDCGAANPLIFAEEVIGKQDILDADFQAAIWEVVNILALSSPSERGVRSRTMRLRS
jgi:hypothetical protein